MMPSQASEKNLSDHLQSVSCLRYPLAEPNHLEEIERYIESHFQNHGLTVEKHAVEFQGKTFSNLTADLRGNSNRVFVVGAHFDAVPNCPGADDNASGVAGLLELVRLFAGESFPFTLRFAAFNLEEFGMVGSQAYVKTLKKQKADIAGMLSLEMIGYTDSKPGSQKFPALLAKQFSNIGNFIGLVGNQKSTKLMDHFYHEIKTDPELPAEKLSVPLNGHVFPETRLSDHSPFWDAGYPALLVTDTSFFRNPHYHLPSDTVATLDLNFMTRVINGVARGIRSFSC